MREIIWDRKQKTRLCSDLQWESELVTQLKQQKSVAFIHWTEWLKSLKAENQDQLYIIYNYIYIVNRIQGYIPQTKWAVCVQKALNTNTPRICRKSGCPGIVCGLQFHGRSPCKRVTMRHSRTKRRKAKFTPLPVLSSATSPVLKAKKVKRFSKMEKTTNLQRQTSVPTAEQQVQFWLLSLRLCLCLSGKMLFVHQRQNAWHPAFIYTSDVTHSVKAPVPDRPPSIPLTEANPFVPWSRQIL